MGHGEQANKAYLYTLKGLRWPQRNQRASPESFYRGKAKTIDQKGDGLCHEPESPSENMS